MTDDERLATGRARTAYGDAAAFRPATKEPLLVRAVPVPQDVPSYRPASAARDLLAGLTVAALAVPSAMAYGQLAGLSPVNGLYALLLPTVAYVLLGSSRRLVIGPEGATSTLVAAAVLPLAVAGSADAVEVASMLALLVAVCFFIAWLLRIGWIADYFSRPVLIGYLHGVAITLVVAQLGKLLGLQISAQEPLGRLWEIVKELGDVSGATMAGQRRRARHARLPEALHAVPARCADRRGCGDRHLLVARPREPRDRARRAGRGRPAATDGADAAAVRHPGAGTRGGRPLPRLVRGRDPHRAHSRGSAASTSARRRSSRPWASRTSAPASPRRSRSGRAAREPR